MNLPVAVLAPDNWAWFFVFSRSRPANPESLWNMLLHASGNRLLDGPLAEGEIPAVLNAVVTVALLALFAGVGWLTLAAPVRPRVAQVAFLLLAGFLLLNKVWSPQYSLWLLPLAVLGPPEVAVPAAVAGHRGAGVGRRRCSHYLGTANRGIEVEWFFLGVLLRDVAVLVLMALVVRDVLRPDGDVVRTSWPGVDDPAGGALDHAPTVPSGARTGDQVP